MTTSKHPVLARKARAKAERDRWQGTLSDAYRLCAPGSGLFSGDTPNMAPPVDPNVFDASARDAIEEWSARMAYAIGLGFQKLVQLEPGDKLKTEIGDNKEALEEAARVLEQVRDVIDGHIQRSNFIIEGLSALRSAAVSTGVLLVHEADVYQPVRFEAVPIDQVFFSEGPTGQIENVYREGRYSVAHIERRWQNATVSDQAREASGKANGEDYRVLVTEATEWIDAEQAYRLTVVEDETQHVVLERTLPETRWIVFRVDKMPGQTFGAGAALQKLPDIKTANRVVELVLANASFAVTGMWQADDDGVLNPANITLTPGVIIPKAQGSAGLQPLRSPAQFDVSQIVLADLRDSIRKAITGPALPGMEQGVRSATEWTIREQQLVILMTPHYTRLYREMVVPLYRVVASILERKGLLGKLDLIGGTVRVSPSSPYADMAKRAEMTNRFQGLQMAAGMDPMETKIVINGEKAVEYVLNAYGWPKDILRNTAERQQTREQMQQAAQMEMRRQAGGGTPQ